MIYLVFDQCLLFLHSNEMYECLPFSMHAANITLCMGDQQDGSDYA